MQGRALRDCLERLCGFHQPGVRGEEGVGSQGVTCMRWMPSPVPATRVAGTRRTDGAAGAAGHSQGRRLTALLERVQGPRFGGTPGQAQVHTHHTAASSMLHPGPVRVPLPITPAPAQVPPNRAAGRSHAPHTRKRVLLQSQRLSGTRRPLFCVGIRCPPAGPEGQWPGICAF